MQPYITVMQLFALTLMLSHDSLTTQTLLNLTCSLPALVGGAALGVVMFRRVNDAAFRSVLLVVLLFSGVVLVV